MHQGNTPGTYASNQFIYQLIVINQAVTTEGGCNVELLLRADSRDDYEVCNHESRS